MKIWNVLPLISGSMPFQMALDEILFRQMEHSNKYLSAISTQDKEVCVRESIRKPILRFYFSSEPWITLGYFSKPTEDQGDIGSCRRMTGGGRVLHGNDFIFSLIAHKSDDVSFGSVQESYLKIHDTIRGAFESLGHSAEFYDEKDNLPKGAECFVHPIASDLKLEGKKIAGGAQKRSSGMLLHHESIQIPELINVKELYPAILKNFQKIFGISFENASWNPELLSQAKSLSAGGYVPGRWSEKASNEKVES